MKKQEKIFDYSESIISKIKSLWELNGYKITVYNVGTFVLVADNFLTSSDPVKIKFTEYESGERGISAWYLKECGPVELDMETTSAIYDTLQILNWRE